MPTRTLHTTIKPMFIEIQESVGGFYRATVYGPHKYQATPYRYITHLDLTHLETPSDIPREVTDEALLLILLDRFQANPKVSRHLSKALAALTRGA